VKVLVTGATGYLGQRIVERLTDHEVVPLSRSLGADITDPESLRGHFDGVDVVVHAAGLVSHDESDAAKLYQVHVVGTQNVLAAARAAGVPRVVYVSTSGTVAVSTDPDFIADEDSETPRAILQRWPYYRSKLYAEQIALDANGPGLEVVCLNPTLLLGPGDATGVSTRPVSLFLEGKVLATPPGGLSFVDVRDVAEAVALALTKGRGGRRYLLGSANMTFERFYATVARITDREPPALKAPGATRALLDWMPKLGRHGFGWGIELERHDLEQACHTWYLDDRRARLELGWTTRDPLVTLRDTVADLYAPA